MASLAKRQGIFAPIYKTNFPECLQEIAGKYIEWKYMGASSMPPIGTGVYMALTDNEDLCEPKNWVLEHSILFFDD